ncbi:MAG: MDR family MFS transporter [Gemmatirosa sp.]
MSVAPIRTDTMPDPAADRALGTQAADPGAPPPLTRAERTATMAGVLLGLLLAGLDQTIVSTAGPAIQRDLRIAPSLYPWVTTAYLVASTVMVPIYGKVSDRRGRKPILLAAISIFLLGSVLCGLSPTTWTLIAARAVQGLGAAGLFTTAFAVIADLYPPRERGRYTGLIGAVMGLSSVVGPLVGGLLTDRFGWHWVFFVNLPIGAVALWFIVSRMPKLGGTARHARKPLDVAGITWLVLGVVPLLLALSLGRPSDTPGDSGLAWTSPTILGLLAVSLIAATLFLRAERRAEDPVIDPRLFRNRTVAYGIAATFVLGAGFLSAVVFLPLFMVNVVGVSATRAGLTMTPLTLGMVIGSVTSGRLVSRTGRYKPLMLLGLAILATGFAIMAFTLSPTSSTTELTFKMLLVGLGIGPTLPLYTLAVQNAAAGRDIGVVTAATTFARSLGQVIGVALVGTVFATTLAGALARESRAALAEVSPATRALLTSSAIATDAAGGETATVSFDRARVRAAVERSVPLPERAASLAAVDRLALAFQRAFTTAIERLYLVGLLFVAVATLLTLRIPQLPLRQHHHGAPLRPPEPLG